MNDPAPTRPTRPAAAEAFDADARVTPRAARRRAATWTALIAAAAAAMALGLVAGDAWRLVRMRQSPSMGYPRLGELLAAQRANPQDPDIRQRYRQLDTVARREYFTRQRRARIGAFILAGALGVFLLAGQLALASRAQRTTAPAGRSDPRDDYRRHRWPRWALVACVPLAAAGLAAWVTRADPAGVPALAAVAVEPVEGTWPRFRGPGGLGVSPYTDLPQSWDAATGRGIRWRAEVPLPGHSSPVVAGNRVFCTGATAELREVYCWEASTGKLLWRREVFTAEGTLAEPPEPQFGTGFAAPTPATDGQRVYAIFANGDLAALDFDGKVLWARYLGPISNIYGHASSLAMYDGKLIVQLDQDSENPESDTRSALLAVDAASGDELYRVGRPVGGAWTSPITYTGPEGRPQILAGGNPWLIAHDPASGEPLWRAKVLSADNAPSPVYADGRAFTAQPNGDVAAIDANGSGDVTESHVKWTSYVAVPDIASPVTDGRRLWTVASDGWMVCYRAADGEILYEKEHRIGVQASPTLAGGVVYLQALDGTMILFAADADEYRQIGRGSVGEKVTATPAFARRTIFIRGQKHLYCIGGDSRP